MKKIKQPSKRLWAKSGEVTDEVMQRLTVGDDPILDRALVVHDCVGSAAHARMLAKCGHLSKLELAKLLKGLRSIYKLGKKEKFDIPPALEDVHTAIEANLVSKLGDAGLRIHTARSRNDQVLLAMRLFLRTQIVQRLDAVLELLAIVQTRFKALKDVPLPGYTHMQPAMPSSVGMWLHALYEELLVVTQRGLSLLEDLDVSPLGGAAGFGVSIKTDPAFVARVLKFKQHYRSPIQANNSRGREELHALQWITYAGAVLEKFVWDMLLYCSREFGFFALPNKLTTGSSIMPQKRNPDLLELARSRCARLRGYETELAWIIGKLPTSYHRDLQLTKRPVMLALKDFSEILEMMKLSVQGFTVNRSRLEAAMHTDLYATYDAYREVKLGRPFREAYRIVAKRVVDGTLDPKVLKRDFAPIQRSVNTGMKLAVRDVKKVASRIKEMRGTLEMLDGTVFG